MSFSKESDYTIERTVLALRDLRDYRDDYITRPPYQRKTVWSVKKKQALMDSILRRFYIPDVVLREVRLTDVASVSEVIDGQQRITTVQSYFDGEFPLPNSLKDFESDLVGKRYEELGTDFRKYIDKLEFQVDKIRGIEVKDNASHQLIATEIFWRLQQGESLNSMEVAHARLSSRVRNFLVQYSDDIEFDFENYKPVESNPKKHRFFKSLIAAMAEWNTSLCWRGCC